MDLETALEQFDTVEANVRRLEKVWEEIGQLTPSGVEFTDGTSPEDRRYRELTRAYHAIVKVLPAIGGVTIESVPWDMNEIAQSRLDAMEIGEFEIQVRAENDIIAPGQEIEEYRAALIRRAANWYAIT